MAYAYISTAKTIGTVTSNTAFWGPMSGGFDYTGAYIPNGTYRVYTTFPSLNFQLFDNQNIYFKGGTVE